jgi:hypothetical protein
MVTFVHVDQPRWLFQDRAINLPRGGRGPVGRAESAVVHRDLLHDVTTVVALAARRSGCLPLSSSTARAGAPCRCLDALDDFFSGADEPDEPSRGQHAQMSPPRGHLRI